MIGFPPSVCGCDGFDGAMVGGMNFRRDKEEKR